MPTREIDAANRQPVIAKKLGVVARSCADLQERMSASTPYAFQKFFPFLQLPGGFHSCLSCRRLQVIRDNQLFLDPIHV
jgi:hypothetical protein